MSGLGQLECQCNMTVMGNVCLLSELSITYTNLFVGVKIILQQLAFQQKEEMKLITLWEQYLQQRNPIYGRSVQQNAEDKFNGNIAKYNI